MADKAGEVFRFSGFRLDAGRGLARDDGTAIPLRAKSLELLLYLAGNPGRVLSKDELLENVWNGVVVTEDSLTQSIHDLRRALGDDRQNLIRTVPRRGYLFAGEVSPEVVAPAPKQPTITDRASLAVLPFHNLSGDPDQDYFADGIVEEIITALTRVKWLTVIARNSTFTYKGRAVDSRTVGQELGVRYVLEGSVRKSGGKVRVSAQLVDASTDTHLWAERFDGAIEDIFELQDRIATMVAGAIGPKLEMAEIGRVVRKPTANLQAYDYYLRALPAFLRITREGNDEALASLYRAIELDPGYATAYGFAARTYVQRSSGAWIEDFERDFAEAERLARRAIELGQDDAVALSCAAFALSDLCGDPQSGVLCIDKALALSPSLASAWLYSGWIRGAIGDVATALAHLQHARRLSPNDPQGFSLWCCEGTAHFAAGDYRRALACTETAMQIKSDYILGLCLAMSSSANAGDEKAAAAALRRARHVVPSISVARVSKIITFYVPEVQEAWFGGLRKAGLPE